VRGIKKFEAFIALKHIRARKRQTILSTSGIALGVALFIVIQAMMSGFTDEIIDLTITNSPSVVVNPKDGDEYINLYKTLETKILSDPRVNATSPFLEGEAILTHKDKTKAVALKGVYIEKERRVFPLDEQTKSGSLHRIGYARNNIVLGDALAKHLEVEVGDKVEVVSVSGRTKEFEIVGIVDTGTPIDESYALVHIKTAQDFFGVGDVVSGIDVKTPYIYEAEAIAKEIRDETGYNTKSWIELNKDIFEVIRIEGTFTWLIGIFVLIIVAFGITNSFIMMVMEKTRDIGMLKAMGATSSQVRNIFLMESVVIGIVGVAVGNVLGVLLSLLLAEYPIEVPSEVYLVSTLPISLHVIDVVKISVFVLLLSIFSAVYPAHRASKLNPVEALKYE